MLQDISGFGHGVDREGLVSATQSRCTDVKDGVGALLACFRMYVGSVIGGRFCSMFRCFRCPAPAARSQAEVGHAAKAGSSCCLAWRPGSSAPRAPPARSRAHRDPAAQHDALNVRNIGAPGLIPPELSDLPPHPPTFKTSDIAKHVARVRDQRLRIRLDPSALQYVDPNSPQGMAARPRALPSICAYTLHDVPEGYVHGVDIRFAMCSLRHSSPCCTFSQDTSLMAAGFEESYIRLWSLKGEPLNGMRSNFEVKRECTRS